MEHSPPSLLVPLLAATLWSNKRTWIEDRSDIKDHLWVKREILTNVKLKDQCGRTILAKLCLSAKYPIFWMTSKFPDQLEWVINLHRIIEIHCQSQWNTKRFFFSGCCLGLNTHFFRYDQIYKTENDRDRSKLKLQLQKNTKAPSFLSGRDQMERNIYVELDW